MSFKNVSYNEILEADSFYDSDWYDLITSKYLFVIYREEELRESQTGQWDAEIRYVLDRVIFWTMPESDMADAEAYWDNIRENIQADRHYMEEDNTYWKLADHKNFHVRPKGKDSSDLQESPISGKKVRKVCYWFNGEYVQKIVQRDYGDEWGKIFISKKK